MRRVAFVLATSLSPALACPPPITVEEGRGPGQFIVYDVEFADVNADGNVDAMVTYLGDEQDDELFLGGPGGSFPRQGIALGRTHVADAEFGDFNGDGRPDLFMGYAADISDNPRGDRLWFNLPEGFVDAELVFDDADTVDVAVGDFNEDGIDDIVTVGQRHRRLHFGAADGALLTAEGAFGDAAARRILAADLDGDMHLDLLVNAREVWLGAGDGTFARSADVFELEEVADVQLADFDGDGVLDAFAAQSRGELHHVYLGDGAGGFTRTEQLLAPSAAAAIALGDFNADGHVDVFLANETDSTDPDRPRQPNRYLLGRGDGTFWDAHLRIGAEISWEAEAVDFDGDGVTDVAFANRFDRNVRLLRSVPQPDGLLDFDADGVVDCDDGCLTDPDKDAPGLCGCGTADNDTDGDGTPDCDDRCVDDPAKTERGRCGCGVPETDTDGDTVPDCVDNCPDTPNPEQADADMDGEGDACGPMPIDMGPVDAATPDPDDGVVVDAGVDGDGAPDPDAAADAPSSDSGGCMAMGGGGSQLPGVLAMVLVGGCLRRRKR